MKEKFAFLGSPRFWKLVIVAVFQILKTEGWIDASIADAITVLLLGSVGIRTLDRFGDKIYSR